MALASILGPLGLDATLQAIRDRLPAGGGLALDTSVASVLAKVEQVRALLAATQTVADPAFTSSTGSLTAAGQAVTVAVAANANTVTFDTGATAFVGTVQFEASIDGGTTWRNIQCSATHSFVTAQLSATSAGTWWAQIHPGVTHVRMRCSAYTSGTIAGFVAVGYMAGAPVVTLSGNTLTTTTLAASAVRAGFTAAAGLWWDDTATALAASATFTGTARDVVGAATGAAWVAGTYGRELRALALTDAAGGTLKVQASRDNTNWYTVRAVAVAAVDGGQVAEAVVPIYTRYARVVFVNGSTAQTRLAVQSVVVAA